jgi:exopolysaccharide biosynthesis polyprenyl glycosylphosphotransferase
MIKQYARAIDLGLRLFDLLVLGLAMPIAQYLYAHHPLARGDAPPFDHLWSALLTVLVLWIGVTSSFGVYAAYRTQTLTQEVVRLLRSLVVVALGVFALLFVVKLGLPRLYVGLYLVIAFGILASSRIAVRTMARGVRRRGYNTRNYAIVGTGAAAEKVARTFADRPHWGIKLVGFILPEAGAPRPRNGKVLGTLEDLGRILDNEVLDEIVFAVPREGLEGVKTAIGLCQEQGVTVLVSLEPLELATGRMALVALSELPMLAFERTPNDPWALAAKRLFDIVVSATALILLAPLFALVAVAIRIETPGPVFFLQKRSGLNGRPFKIVKFRSMYADAEQRLGALLARNEMSGPVFKIRDDPRITKVGRFLRRTSIDELPQFWNVLRGEMSIVGPRPPIPDEVRQYQRWQRRRLSVRPGITCTWQVSGRNAISFERWMELDLEYIDNWTLKRDFEIFFRTIPAVLTGRGAS